MLIWVTGCSGFLGKRLMYSLCSVKRNEVVGISRSKHMPKENIYKIDLSDQEALDNLKALADQVGWPDILVHLASKLPGPFRLNEYILSNICSTANLLDFVKGSAIDKLIYTSTLSVYSEPEKNPVTEHHTTHSNSPYVLSKLAAENLIKIVDDSFDSVILRLPSLYGHGQHDSFIDGLAKKAMKNEDIELYGNGDTVRDAIHVSDAVKAITGCFDKSFDKTYTINIGCGQPITTRQYVETLSQKLCSKSKIFLTDKVSPQKYDLYADITLAKKMLGYYPSTLNESMEIYANELSNQK